MFGIPGIPGLPSLLGGGLFSDPFSAFFNAFGSMVWHWIVNGATAIFDAMIKAIGQSGPINFSSGSWWGAKVGLANTGTSLWAIVVGLALSVMLICVLLAAIQGAIAGEPMMAIKAVFVSVPTSMFGMVAVVAFTTVLVGVVDGASNSVLSVATPNFKEWFGNGGGVAFMSGLVMIITALGALLVWMELILRAGFVYLFVLLSPLALAVRIWPAMGGFFKRYAEIGIALIVSKFVIAAALALGSAAMAGGSKDAASAQGIAALATGAGLVLVSAFSPFVILRMVHGIEGALAHQGVSHAPGRAAMTAVQLATSALLIGRLAAGGGGGGGGGGPAALPEPTGNTGGKTGTDIELANQRGPTNRGGSTGPTATATARPTAPPPQPLPPPPRTALPPAPPPALPPSSPQALPPGPAPEGPPPASPRPPPSPPAPPGPGVGRPPSLGSSGVFIDANARPVPAGSSDRS
jgi:hypothetical protein